MPPKLMRPQPAQHLLLDPGVVRSVKVVEAVLQAGIPIQVVPRSWQIHDPDGDKVRGLRSGADDYLTKPFGVATRRKLEPEPAVPRYILTVRKSGYRLAAGW